MQVSEWLQKFDSKRGVARRRPPSYLQPPTAEAEPYLLEQQVTLASCCAAWHCLSD